MGSEMCIRDRSGSEGLAQLGIFTASGLVIAALVTRFWLPVFLNQQPLPAAENTPVLQQPSLRNVFALATLVLTIIGIQLLFKNGFWDDRMSSLSPVPEQRLLRDGQLRSAAGTQDMRYQLVHHAADLEGLLRQSESIQPQVEQAAGQGLLESWQSVSQLLPSQSLQQSRQRAIPESSELANRLRVAMESTPFHEAAFEPFIQNAGRSRALPLLTPDQFNGTPLAAWLDAHLARVRGQWVSLVSVSQPKPAQLASYLEAELPQVALVDLQESSIELMRNYRHGAMKTISLASFVIIALLLFETKTARRVVWIALTVTSSLAFTATLVTALHGGLTIIHLVALILVMGLGLDYALFMSRSESRQEQGATMHAVIACAVTTTLTFGILAGSSIPVLKFLGLTVATGAAASFVMAYAGSRLFTPRAG